MLYSFVYPSFCLSVFVCVCDKSKSDEWMFMMNIIKGISSCILEKIRGPQWPSG